jgi:hypothetical protein
MHLSDRFCYYSVWSTLNHESKTEDFLFFVLQCVSRADTVKLNAPPLINTNEEVMRVVQSLPSGRPKDFFAAGIRKLPERWTNFIAKQGQQQLI